MAPAPADRQYDVAIIGTGMAGALAAYHLRKAGLDVIMLEAGATIPEFETRALLRRKYAASSGKTQTSPYAGLVAPQPNEIESPFAPTAGRDYYDENTGTDNNKLFLSYYQRTLGGAMAHWQGLSLRMVPNDFRLKSSYGVEGAVDWPITYDTLEKYYTAAEIEIGVAGNDEMDRLLGVPRSSAFPMPEVPLTYQDELIKRALANEKFQGKSLNVTAVPQARLTTEKKYPGRIDGIHPRRICEGYGTCVPLCPTRAKYESLFHVEEALKIGADLRTKAIVRELILEDSSSRRLIEAKYVQWDGATEGKVRAKLFVLAANGIETPKLLLLSRNQRPEGLANSSGRVGCCLMDHPIKMSYAQLPMPVYPFRGPPSTAGIEAFRDGGFRQKFAAFRVSIRNDGWAFANAAPRGKDPRRPNDSRGTILQFVAQEKRFGIDLKNHLINSLHRQLLLYSACEMLPRESNRVSLSNKVDRLGIPRPKIEFEIDEYAREGLRQSGALHEQIFKALGCKKRNEDFWIDLQSDAGTPDFGSGHIMGTTVMGDRGKTVVDSFGRTHDCDNLVIMGSSVFPTSAVANPTLTIAALTLRTVEDILQNRAKYGL